MKKSNRRQSDHWTKKAKQAGFQARSVFKLEEINKKFGVLKGKRRALDLGCCPGSWYSMSLEQHRNVTLWELTYKKHPLTPVNFLRCQ